LKKGNSFRALPIDSVNLQAARDSACRLPGSYSHVTVIHLSISERF